MPQFEGIFMSKKNQMEFSVIEDFRHGKISREDAALKLNCSTRSITRKAKKIREKGLSGVKHGNTGKPPKNKYSSEIRDYYVGLYREKYSNFNFQHALEMIIQIEKPSILVSYETFRMWCRASGLGKVKKRRTSKARVSRERSAEKGYMLQLDGSPHKYNGKEEWCCISIIDDATSELLFSKFFKSETTWACMEAIRSVIEKFGIPEFILTDRAGWAVSKSKKRNSFTQFSRACSELGITVIGTSSAESKGRIERFNRTLQDRIIPELELFGYSRMTECNQYLEQVFLPTFNEKFSVVSTAKTSRFKPVPLEKDLEDIFCYKTERIVNRASLVNYKAEIYVVKAQDGRKLAQKNVTVHEYKNGKVRVFYGGLKLITNKATRYQKRAARAGGW